MFNLYFLRQKRLIALWSKGIYIPSHFFCENWQPWPEPRPVFSYFGLLANKDLLTELRELCSAWAISITPETLARYFIRIVLATQS